MKFFIIQPPAPLCRLVNFFWVSRYTPSDNQPFIYYSIAETCAKFVFMYPASGGSPVLESDDFYSVLQGQTDTHRQFPTSGAFEIFGVSLCPAAIPRLFGFEAVEIHNLTAGMPELFGRDGQELNEKMAAASGNQERIEIISSFLLKRVEQSGKQQLHSPVHTAIRRIQVTRGHVEIAELAKSHFMSQKQFKRKFLRESGFTPKLFARIVRFESAVAGYHFFPSLTEMAHACGYYDQSHFIRDFKEFSGYSPLRYFSLASDQL